MNADLLPVRVPGRPDLPDRPAAAGGGDVRGPGTGRGGPIDTEPTLDGFLAAHLPALVRYGTALTGNAHDGADLVQAVCEKAVLHWARVSAANDPVLYVKAMMANARISSWRRHRRESLLAEPPERATVDRYPVENEGLWAAVAALPRRQRAVIVLRYVEGHSEAEIAAALGVAPGTVKSQAAKAMAHLRLAMATESGQAR